MYATSVNSIKFRKEDSIRLLIFKNAKKDCYQVACAFGPGSHQDGGAG